MEGQVISGDTQYLGKPDTVSRTYQLDDNQMNNLKKYIGDFDAGNLNSTTGYNLRNRQCASFAYGAARAAGISDIKMPWYKWVTPKSLSKKIKSLIVSPCC
jgi:hypothetical protein